MAQGRRYKAGDKVRLRSCDRHVWTVIGYDNEYESYIIERKKRQKGKRCQLPILEHGYNLKPSDRRKVPLIPHPDCCLEIKAFPVVYMVVDPDGLNERDSVHPTPLWTASPQYHAADIERSLWPVKGLNFCPFCGHPLPQFRRNPNPPEPVCRSVDGNYCSTCGHRLDKCECNDHRLMWLLAK